MSLKIRWLSVVPHDGSRWQQAYKDGLKAIVLGGELIQESLGSDETDLVVLSYDAASHELLERESLLSAAIITAGLAPNLPMLLVSCGYAENDVSTDDLRSMVVMQIPTIATQLSIYRALSPPDLSDQVEQFIRANMPVVPLADPGNSDDDDWDF